LILLGELLTRRLSLVKYVTRFYCLINEQLID
jgi:hypothetical protein